MADTTFRDLAAVLEASQALCGILELDELLVRIVQVMLQYSSADRAVLLLLDDGGQWMVRAIATPKETRLHSHPLTESVNLPVELLQYVSSTQNTIVIDGRTLEPATAILDERWPQPERGFCCPLLHQGQWVGMLYLENPATPRAFAPEGQKAIEFLCDGAAISLHNARFYARERQETQRLQQSVAALEKSRTRFREWFEESADAAVILDGGLFVDCNRAAVKMMGCTDKAMLLSLSPVQISPEFQPDGQSSTEKAKKMIETAMIRGNHRFEWLCRRLDGEEFWVEVVLTLLPETDRPVFHGIWRDIGDRKQAEITSKTYRERLGFLIEQTPIGIVEWNTQFEIVGWNPAAAKIFGYSASEMLGKPATQILPESERPSVSKVMESLLEHRGGLYSLNQNICKNGSLITCEWINIPLRDPEGKASGVFSMVQDISDRERAKTEILRKSRELEAALAASQKVRSQLQVSEIFLQKQATALFELTQHPAINRGKIEIAFRELNEVLAKLLNVERTSIWLADTNYTKIQCADLFERSTKLHSQGVELRATNYPTYFKAVMSHPSITAHDARTDPRTREFLHGYLDLLGIVSMLDTCIYVNGEMRGVICCEQVGEPRTWTPSEEIFVRSVANLTALTLETAQRQANSRKLEQALQQLQQTQLQMVQGEKMASLGNLVAGVAHEINNPIGFLNGSIRNIADYLQDLFEYLEIYQQHQPPIDLVRDSAEEIDLEFILEDLPKILDSMGGATDRIKAISNSLRLFSRADTENKVKANLHEALNSTLLILKYRLKANDLRPEIVVLKDYGELPEINCFPGQLNQVFMNLLANAIDALEEANQGKSYDEIEANPNQITIHTRVVSDRLQIRIQDNGCGMSPEARDRVFEQGFTTKAVGKGTGLGMAIAKQIVEEKHGGAIACRSERNRGTEFEILLPID
ncbi:MAG: PAS domain S-box protein [Cyanobacteria bacterium P01_E01_bin.42]